jgi:hypothetical protein
MLFLVLLLATFAAFSLFFLLMGIKSRWGKKGEGDIHCGGCAYEGTCEGNVTHEQCRYYEQHHGNVISQTKKAVERL